MKQCVANKTMLLMHSLRMLRSMNMNNSANQTSYVLVCLVLMGVSQCQASSGGAYSLQQWAMQQRSCVLWSVKFLSRTFRYMLEWFVQSRMNHLTSVVDLTDALVADCDQILTSQQCSNIRYNTIAEEQRINRYTYKALQPIVLFLRCIS